MTLTPAQENYIKAISDIYESKGLVRITDIACMLKVSKATVSKTVQRLMKLGLVTKETYGTVYLSESGKAESKSIWKRNRILKGFLTDVLGVDDKTSEKDACLAEHVLSPQTIEKIEILYSRYKME